MTPQINVNLKPCTCPPGSLAVGIVHFSNRCDATPLPIPCPIPRSVTFEVTLGDCDGRECYSQFMRLESVSHGPSCPANPMKVSCSIDGETWAGSEVTGVEVVHPLAPPFPSLLEIARKRWALVKSLVLGHSIEGCPETIRNMRAQRDAVFAALADMARAEEASWSAQSRAVSLLDEWHDDGWHLNPETHGDTLPSSKLLSAYVSHLLEQVSTLQ